MTLQQLPVTVISGFLGAGKTIEANIDAAIVQNEASLSRSVKKLEKMN